MLGHTQALAFFCRLQMKQLALAHVQCVIYSVIIFFCFVLGGKTRSEEAEGSHQTSDGQTEKFSLCQGKDALTVLALFPSSDGGADSLDLTSARQL